MGKVVLFFGIAIILLFDYAALDDITTSRQESFLAEYLFLLFSVVIFMIIGIQFPLKKN